MFIFNLELFDRVKSMLLGSGSMFANPVSKVYVCNDGQNNSRLHICACGLLVIINENRMCEIGC